VSGEAPGAGALRHRVTLQTPQETADGGGGASVAWTDLAVVWAAIEPLRGSERPRAGQIESPLTHRVVIRHRDDVTPRLRIKFGARLFNIRAVIDPGERRCHLELLCEEGVAT